MPYLKLAVDFQPSYFGTLINSIRYTFVAISGALLVWALWTAFVTVTRMRGMPPGPRGLPLLGNLFDLPIARPWLKLAEWRKEHGALYTLNMAGKPILIVNSHKVASDLFDHRAGIYSDRPHFPMASQIMTSGLFIALGKYRNPVWKRMRRAASENFTAHACEQYQPMQMTQARLTALDIMNSPGEWADAIARAMASNILTTVYGWPRIDSENKDTTLIKRIHAHVEHISDAAIPGRYLVDAFPAMRHIPAWMAKWKREGLAWHESESQLFAQFSEGVKNRMAKGESPTCFVAHLLNTTQRHGLAPKERDWLAGVMFAAGADTSSATLRSLALAMLTWPDTMRKAQTELDEVVGRHRLPTFKDKEKLPYVRAMVNEVLRWRPAAPLAVPRSTTRDDVYNGYVIPKDTFILANVWAMNHDPEIFPEPNTFRPERWLEPSPRASQYDTGLSEKPAMGPGVNNVWFGFGRRVCIGQHFAAQALFVNIATFLWAFDFQKEIDAFGCPITPDVNAVLDSGLVLAPVSFPCVMTPRFPEARSVLERELTMAHAL